MSKSGLWSDNASGLLCQKNRFFFLKKFLFI